jgi:hypothetical protein
MSSLLNPDDFTLYQSGGKLMSGDFEINLDNQNGGGSGDNLLKNLAMPLYYFSKSGGKKKYHNYDEEDEQDKKVIDNDIFDKLLKMVEYKADDKNLDKNLDKNVNKIKKRGTRKHKDIIKGKKTRKN